MKKAKEAAIQYQTATKKAATEPVVAAPASVAISADLLERLQQAAEWKGITLEEAVDTAVLDYFYQYAYEKVKQEEVVFEQEKTTLLKRYRGQYIALHNGKVVAHADNLSSLRQKVFSRYGHTPMLHKLVTPEPERDIIIRSPRLER